jgi:hypothetical protein
MHLAGFGNCKIKLQPGRQLNSGYKIVLKQIFIYFTIPFVKVMRRNCSTYVLISSNLKKLFHYTNFGYTTWEGHGTKFTLRSNI